MIDFSLIFTFLNIFLSFISYIVNIENNEIVIFFASGFYFRNLSFNCLSFSTFLFIRILFIYLYEWQLMLHDTGNIFSKELKNIVWYSKMLKCDQRNSIRFAVVSCNFRDIESLSTYCYVEIIHKISKCLWDRTIRF